MLKIATRIPRMHPKAKSFPKNILANMFGFEEKEYFEAKESSNEVPNVSFE